jgi:hypothetical protein
MLSRRFALSILAFLCVALIVGIVFGGEIFGPYFETSLDKAELTNFLATCPADELRLKFFSGEGRKLELIFNFETRTAKGFCDENVGPWGLFWTRRNPFTNTMTTCLAGPPVIYTDEVLAELRRELAALPQQDAGGLELNLGEAYFTFWRDRKRIVYHCGRDQAYTVHKPLIQMLGLSSL